MGHMEELREIHKKSKWKCVYGPAIGIIILCGLFYLFAPWDIWILSKFQAISMTILIVLMLAACIFVLAEYLLWHRKAKTLARNGESFAPRKVRNFGLLETYLNLYLICFGTGSLLDWLYIRNSKFCGFTFICLCVVILLSEAFYLCRKKEKMGKWKWVPLSMAVLIVCFSVGVGIYTAQNGTWWKYDEHEIQVSLEDLGIPGTNPDDRVAEFSATPWLSEWYYSDGLEEDGEDVVSIYYTVYTAKNEKIYDALLRESYLEDSWYTFKEVQEDAFQADQVYFDEKQNVWLLLKDNQIIAFEGDVRLNEEQKSIIGEKLLGNL